MRVTRLTVATEDLTRRLDEAGMRYELLPHSRTESAAAEAKELALAPDEVAKTLIVSTPERQSTGTLAGFTSGAPRGEKVQCLAPLRVRGHKRVALHADLTIVRLAQAQAEREPFRLRRTPVGRARGWPRSAVRSP
jgi:hypothetical protein